MKKKILSLILFMLIFASLVLPVQGQFANNVNDEKNMDNGNELRDDAIEWWSMFHHDIQLTGFTPADSPDTNKTLWENQIDKDIWCSSPAIVDDNLFIGTGHRYDLQSNGLVDFYNFYETHFFMKDHSFFNIIKNEQTPLSFEIGKLYRLNAQTGGIIWDFEAKGSVFSSPTVENGLVYFVSADSNNYSGKIYCLDIDTGNELWSLPVMTGYSTPTLHDGKLYLLTINPDDYFGKLLCVDASNGDELWNTTTGYIDFSLYTAPALDNGKIFFTSVDVTTGIHCKISCLNESTGELLWNTTMSEMNFGYALSSPVIDNNKAYVISADTKGTEEFWCVLTCFDTSNGSILWNYTMKDTTNELSFASPAVAYGNVYFTSIGEEWTYGKMTCLNGENGSVNWVYLSNDAYTLSSPIVSQEKVFVGALNMSLYKGNIFCFNAHTGTLIYTAFVDNHFIDSTPALANNTLYVGSSFGKICALKDMFKVGEIKGGLATVKTDITNVGGSDILNLNYTISIVGGMFNQINTQKNETIDVLEAQTSDIIRVFPIIGLGKIEITITIYLEGVNPVVKKAEGVILGIFVLMT